MVTTLILAGLLAAPQVPAAEYYPDALRAYWSENHTAAFVLAALAVECDPNPKRVEHAAYLTTVLALEKMTEVQLDESAADARIAPLMLDLYGKTLRALRTNDHSTAYRAWRDFALATPSERWQRVAVGLGVPVGHSTPKTLGERDLNLAFAELVLRLDGEPTVVGRIVETTFPETPAQKIRAAKILAGISERTGDVAWGEKAFHAWLEAGQTVAAEALASRLVTNNATSFDLLMSLANGFMHRKMNERAGEVLTIAARRFRSDKAEIVLARAELDRRARRYDKLLQELLAAGKNSASFRAAHYHPVWAKPFDVAGLATGPDDSVYAITSESKPRVLHLSRAGDVQAQYGPFEDPTVDGVHPFAVFSDGTFLIRNRRYSPAGALVREYPLSPSVRAVSIDNDQRVFALGQTDGIKILDADGRQLSHCQWEGRDMSGCVALAGSGNQILLLTSQGPRWVNQDCRFTGYWDNTRYRHLSAGCDDLFYLCNANATRVIRSSHPNQWETIQSLPLGGSVIAAATAGGFYVGGVKTERGAWLVKFAPAIVPRE
jgi:hypothetical protein